MGFSFLSLLSLHIQENIHLQGPPPQPDEINQVSGKKPTHCRGSVEKEKKRTSLIMSLSLCAKKPHVTCGGHGLVLAQNPLSLVSLFTEPWLYLGW